jgi:hypothetical protein
MDVAQIQNQSLKISQSQRIGAITKRMIRIRVNLHENAVRAGCNSGPGQWGHKRSISPRATVTATGKLRGMCRIKYYRISEAFHA